MYRNEIDYDIFAQTYVRLCPVIKSGIYTELCSTQAIIVGL